MLARYVLQYLSDDMIMLVARTNCKQCQRTLVRSSAPLYILSASLPPSLSIPHLSYSLSIPHLSYSPSLLHLSSFPLPSSLLSSLSLSPPPLLLPSPPALPLPLPLSHLGPHSSLTPFPLSPDYTISMLWRRIIL